MNKQTIEFLEYLANFSEGDNYTITAEFLDTMKFAIEDLKKIDKAIEVIDLITPELWNISNAMTYKLKDVKYILKGGNNEK